MMLKTKSVVGIVLKNEAPERQVPNYYNYLSPTYGWPL